MDARFKKKNASEAAPFYRVGKEKDCFFYIALNLQFDTIHVFLILFGHILSFAPLYFKNKLTY